MITIESHSGDRHVVIDDVDADLTMYVWYSGRKGDLLAFPPGYQAKPRRVKYLSLHRTICERANGPAAGRIADHRNRDRTDNRRENLRWATCSQSNWNRRSKNRTGFKGVFEQRQCTRKRFGALIEKDGKTYHLGGFETAEQAARAYDAAATRLGGEYAYLNFPEERNA